MGMHWSIESQTTDLLDYMFGICIRILGMEKHVIWDFFEFHLSFKADMKEVQIHKILNRKAKHINVGLTKNEANRFSN